MFSMNFFLVRQKTFVCVNFQKPADSSFKLSICKAVYEKACPRERLADPALPPKVAKKYFPKRCAGSETYAQTTFRFFSVN